MTTDNWCKKISLVVVSAVIMLFTVTTAFAVEESLDGDQLVDLSIEELMEVPLEVSGSLTGTTRRKIPSTVTTITRSDIRHCGARSLDELLEIYVPNLQIAIHMHEFQHLGIRGINTDKEDKYLLLVNGRVMNERFTYGAISERDLPMLTDIHHVDIIRGPGSALYGPGAISMVINIITETAETFEGTQVTTRLGAIEEFYSIEAKHGEKIDEDRGIFVFGGISKYLGADSDAAPFYYGTKNATGLELDEVVSRKHESLLDRSKLKFHLNYTDNDFDVLGIDFDHFELWTRYTRGGEHFDPNNDRVPPKGAGYQQATSFIGLTKEINAELTAEFSFSYDMFDFHKVRAPQHADPNRHWLANREDEYYGQILLQYNPHERHSFVFGGEMRHEEFGLGSPSANNYANHYRFSSSIAPRWSTDMYSILGEYQYQINDTLTSFLGARLDDHTNTNWMFSPRAVLVYTPTDDQTVKGMWSRSVRTNLAAELKAEDIATPGGASKTDTEEIEVFELRYEKQQTENLWWATSLFYNDHDVVGWIGGLTAPIGTMRSMGFEIEGTYKTEKTKVTLSHGFTKLVEFHQAEGAKNQLISAHEKGDPVRSVGHDIANWSNQITKLTAYRSLSKQFSIDGSLAVYWGYPGSEDMALFYEGPNDRYQPGYDAPFDLSAFLNLGLEYKPQENLRLRLDAYNVLGWCDKEYNGRPYGWNDGSGNFSMGNWRADAPAIGVSLTYKF